MNATTSPAQRQALAAQHRRAAAAAARTPRQRLRLALLRAWGWRYRAAQPSPSPHSCRRILVIRPDHLGDVLFTTPALHLLRRALPAAHISVLLGPWSQAVLADTSDADEILTCAFPGFSRQPATVLTAPYRLLRAEAQRLAAQHFDLALVLRFDHWWGAWLAAAAGIPRRVGYAWPETAPFLTQAVPYQPGRHEVAQNLALVAAASQLDEAAWQPESLGLRVAVSPQDMAAAEALLPARAAASVVALHPGSGAEVKRWQPAAWAETVTALVRTTGAQVLFTGAASEAAEINAVLALLPPNLAPTPVTLAGQTSLGVLAALYRRCALVIGPDSGPLHLAVAVGTPTVHLYGPVDQRTFGPWGNAQRHRVLVSDWGCIPCNRLDWPAAALAAHGCVRDISVAAVVNAALPWLAPLASAAI